MIQHGPRRDSRPDPRHGPRHDPRHGPRHDSRHDPRHDPEPRQVTRLLSHWQDGDAAAGGAALAMVYADLRRLAQVYLRREAPDHTLQPTALVHEAYLRLIGNAGASPPRLESGAHLIGVAARLMRQILVNHAHRRRTLRRGGDRRRLDLDPALAVFEERAVDLVALDEALERLSGLDPRQARIVEMRFFGAMTVEETARALDTSVRTVERDWTMARAWLSRELAKT